MIRFRNPERPLRLKARWLFPVDCPPIENGIVEIAEGEIRVISNHDDPHAVDLGNVAILPGLVNAHTHLELSDCPTPLAPSAPFTEWIRSVMKHRRSRRPVSSLLTSPQTGPLWQGAWECGRFGTTCVADIAGVDWQPGLLPGDGPRTVAFLEVLGLAPERIPELLDRAREHLALGRTGDLATSSAPPHLGFGLSPHAPYSVHPTLLKGLVDLAIESGAPVAMHLAETRSELELLARGGGEFAEFLKRLAVWNPDVFRERRSILDYLKELARSPRGLVVHGNYLSDADIEFLARNPQLSVVYCPRTHAYFGHEPHPWRTLLERNINVALGTDSRASNPDLSVWNELQFLRRCEPEVPGQTLLELATIRGARALGLEAHCGTITPGRSADLAIIDLPAVPSADPYDTLLHPSSRIQATVLRGHWLGAP